MHTTTEPTEPTAPATIGTNYAALIAALRRNGFAPAWSSPNAIDRATARPGDLRMVNDAGDLVTISPARDRVMIGHHTRDLGDLTTLQYDRGYLTASVFLARRPQAATIAALLESI